MASALFAAGEPQREKLLNTIEAALDVIYSDCCKDLPEDEKQAKIRERLESNYDLNVIIRRAIGRNWRLMSESVQTEVLDLVKQLVVKAYVRGMDGASRPEIRLGEVTQITDKRIEIPSTVVLDGKTYSVLYRLGRMSSGWQIYDIVAENISVVSNYREQIDDHFRQKDGEALVSRLKEILEKDAINEDIQI